MLVYLTVITIKNLNLIILIAIYDIEHSFILNLSKNSHSTKISLFSLKLFRLGRWVSFQTLIRWVAHGNFFFSLSLFFVSILNNGVSYQALPIKTWRGVRKRKQWGYPERSHYCFYSLGRDLTMADQRFALLGKHNTHLHATPPKNVTISGCKFVYIE